MLKVKSHQLTIMKRGLHNFLHRTGGMEVLSAGVVKS